MPSLWPSAVKHVLPTTPCDLLIRRLKKMKLQYCKGILTSKSYVYKKLHGVSWPPLCPEVAPGKAQGTHEE